MQNISRSNQTGMICHTQCTLNKIPYVIHQKHHTRTIIRNYITPDPNIGAAAKPKYYREHTYGKPTNFLDL